MSEPLICFCGGGSGGHLSPLYALYQEWQKQQKTNHIKFILPNNQFDISYCQARQLPFYTLHGTRFYQGNPLKISLKLFLAVLEIVLLFRRQKPQAIIGTGGYGSVPVYLYALINNIPLFLIEPNKIAGKVNKAFSPFATIIFTHFAKPHGLKSYQAKIKNFGNPIVTAIPPNTIATKRRQLLVFGASLGAESINEFMQRLIQANLLSNPVTWITGQKSFAQYQHLHCPPQITIYPFYDQMPELYTKSCLAICRAGINTVNEIHFFQLPAIFIPYPHHQDRQQYLNCEHLIQSQACLLWEDEFLKDIKSQQLLLELLNKAHEIDTMSQKFPDYPQRNAAKNIIATLRGYCT